MNEINGCLHHKSRGPVKKQKKFKHLPNMQSSLPNIENLLVTLRHFFLEMSQYKYQQTTMRQEFHYLEKYCLNLRLISIEIFANFAESLESWCQTAYDLVNVLINFYASYNTRCL